MIITKNEHRLGQMLYEIRNLGEFEIYTYKSVDQINTDVQPDIIFCEGTVVEEIEESWSRKPKIISMDILYSGINPWEIDKNKLLKLMNHDNFGGTL